MTHQCFFYLSSAKTYNLTRELLPLPAYQNLYIKFGGQIKQEKKNLTGIAEIDNIVKSYLSENNFKNETNKVVTLAIDAFAFKSFASVAMTPNKTPQPNNEKKK